MRRLIILGLFLSTAAHADDLLLGVGLGVFNSGKKSLSESKFIKLGLQEDLWGIVKQRLNAGGWIDNAGNGRHDSAFGGYQIGFDVSNDVLEMSVFTGPTLISTPDTYLGGVFQFNDTAFLGVVDKQGNSIGAAYEHFSSAGIETPNIGRDFVGLQIKMPLN